WNAISLNGVTQPAHFLSDRRVILCNQLCLFTIIDTLLYEGFFLHFGVHSLIVFHTASIAAYFYVLQLNKRGHYQRAKTLLLTTTSAEVFFISGALGTASGIFLYYFPIICAAFVLFDYQERRKTILVVSTALACTLVLHVPFLADRLPTVPVTAHAQQFLFYATLATSMLITVLCVYHLVRSNALAEGQLREAVLKEEDLNAELQAGEEELLAHLNHLSLLTRQVESEKAKLSAIVESSDHLIWSLDRNYRLIYSNSNHAALFRKQFGNELRPGDNILTRVPAGTAARWQALYDKALQGHKFTEEVQGRKSVLEVFFTPIVEAGEVVGVTVFMQNISARKAAERDLVAAKEVAEKASLAKAQFLSTMSHEIRTPMNAVVGLTHLLLQQDPRPDQSELLQTLQFSSENLLSLINNILDLHKIEAGKVTFESIDFSPAELVAKIIRTHQFKAAEKGIALRSTADPGLPAVLKGDPARLTQVLNNLISNAIKFTDAGSVTLGIGVEASAENACTLHFSVTDTGIGIPAEKQGVIFDAFVQADADTTRKYGGTGLGLAITKRLLELQESTLQLTSRPGEGSRFYFRLQLQKGTSTPPAVCAPSRFRTDDLGTLRLLLVDDNEINVMVAAKFLQKWKITPDCAPNGLIALGKVRERTYDLVLMDLQMPVMDGFEAARRIREMGGAYAAIPIIALTADTVAGVREQALAAGMNDFLTKPYSPDDLHRVITRHVRPDNTANGSAPAVHDPAAPPVRRLRKLYEMADGDQDFVVDMVFSCKCGLEELLEGAVLALSAHDELQLRAMIHKAKVLLELLDLAELRTVLDAGKELLKNAPPSEVQVQKTITHLAEFGQSALFEL
ncbi:MAG TPA: ATP-binding protein, partial [Cytophagales bacterium]